MPLDLALLGHCEPFCEAVALDLYLPQPAPVLGRLAACWLRLWGYFQLGPWRYLGLGLWHHLGLGRWHLSLIHI